MAGTAFVNRAISKEGLDFYPTPAWATRALYNTGFKTPGVVWEPACGLYHMSKVLKEFNEDVIETDIIYGQDFMNDEPSNADWIITNPPFNIIQDFTLRALEVTNRGVALFVRYPFLETAKRYNSIFKYHKPSHIYQFSERVAFLPDKVAKKGGASAVVYVWVIWDKEHKGDTTFSWIPPNTRTLLERDEDYDE